jgi:sugar lactone lactonase YvrE
MADRVTIAGLAFVLAALVLSAAPGPVRVASEYGRIPARFDANLGQAGRNTLFTARGAGYSLALKKNGATLSLTGARGPAHVSLELVKANARTTVTPEEPLGGQSNYYFGDNPKRWITGVPQFARVRYRDVYPGVDLVWHGNQQQLEYDLILGPGADPGRIRLRFHGADALSVADNGDLLLRVRGGELRQLLPAVWQQRGTERVRIDARYVLLARGEVGVRVAVYDRSLPLVIDPILSYSTFLAGSGWTFPTAIAVDSNGNAYVTGDTTTDDFPGTSGAGGLFVAELNAAGTGIVYVTYFGGNNSSYPDQATGIAVDGSGNAYATGATSSTNFPVTQGTLKSTKTTFDWDGFVVKFGPGGQIVWGTYLGGSADDYGNAIAVDSFGNSYVAGASDSTDSPTTSGACASNQDAFVATLNATGSALLNAVCLGGNGADAATAIALDGQLNVYVAGTTQSTDLATTSGAFQTSLNGGQNAFAARLASGALTYLTYLGGRGDEWAPSLAVDSGGNAYVAGSTDSPDFPTTAGAFDPSTSNPYGTGFIARLNPAATALVWSTFLGGTSGDPIPYDEISGVAIDAAGNAYVAGATYSLNFPTTTGAIFSSEISSDSDVFVAELSADGSTLEYSGRIGGTGNSSATALARSGSGALYITGTTYNGDYPTTPGAYQSASPAQNNAAGFVTKIDMTSPATCSVSLSANGAEIAYSGGGGSFNVTVPAGCPWEAIPDPWITLGTVTQGTTSATVSFTVGFNDSLYSRTGHIQIGPATYTIAQDAGSCSDPVFNPTSLAFGNAGGPGNVNVTLPSVCPQAASVSDGWIQIASGGNTNGSGNVGVSVAANSFGQRSGTVTIAGQTVPVTEDAGPCTATVTGPASALPSSGASGTFQIATSAPSCQWAVYAVPSWVQINSVSLSGQGRASLGFVVAPNPTAVSRAATLTMAGQPVTLTQNAGPIDNVPDSYSASVFAGNGQCCGGVQGDGGPATLAFLWNPQGLAWQSGNLYIADPGNERVRVVTPDGLINTFAGGGTATSGPATTVSLVFPMSLAFAPDGTMYVADELCCVWRIANGTAGIFAGQGTNGPGDQLSNPNGVAVDGSGNVYIADSGNNRIREVSSGVVTTIAGNGACEFNGDNGPASAAALCSPDGLAALSPVYAGSLFVADSQNQRIRTFAPGGTITTFAGGGSGSYPGTGSYVAATSVVLSDPVQLAFDPIGNLYIADAGIPAVWRVISWNSATLQTPQIANLIGGSSGIWLNTTNGVAADEAGNVYVSDSARVWKLTPQYSSAFCSVNQYVGGPLVLYPADGTTGVVTDPILAWTTVTGATSYNVYFGTSNPPPLAGSATCTSYSPKGLAANTTYYWQIVPQGASGLTASAVQSFTTLTGETGAVTLTLNTVGSGTVAADPPSPDGTYYAGTKVCLTATPAAGWLFGSWSGATLDSSNCLTLNSNVSVTANFVSASALLFVPMTPCRVADTRYANGAFGSPELAAGSTRDFVIPSGSCNIPATAAAYSLNVTVVPNGALGWLTVWPSGQTQPHVSTLNSADGRIKANAAIVPAGAGGAVSVYVTDATNVILDVDGYFVPAASNASALAFYPLPPCRVADTRYASFGALLGPPSLSAGETRSFPILSSSCNVPASAQAYSLNFTVVPSGSLGYITTYPTGQTMPLASTLNAPTGTIVANAAIVPAGTGGAVSVYSTAATDLVIDINGYFAPPGTGGLSLYNLTPCRVLDTRLPSGSPPFSGELDVNVSGSGCGATAAAQAYVFNATVVPPGPMLYLTLWPQGGAEPLVSTLNAPDGAITSNMAIVPTSNGIIAAAPSALTYLILDIFGYFAP